MLIAGEASEGTNRGREINKDFRGLNIFKLCGESTEWEIVFKSLLPPISSSLQLWPAEGGGFEDYDWNPIMQTILVNISKIPMLYIWVPLTFPFSRSSLAFWQLHPASTSSTPSCSTQAQAMVWARPTLRAAPPTSTSADYTRGKLRLRLKLSLTLATTACPWPTTPATLAGPESEVLASPPPAGAAAARGVLSPMVFLF